MACQVVDTFDDFAQLWPEIADQAPEAQLEAWRDRYMSRWPELLNKQLEDRRREGADWKQIAIERVFFHLKQWFPSMTQVHDLLIEILDPVYDLACRRLGYQEDLTFVIYVGVGVGAGWATTYQGRPAVLLGLENIAECGWSSRSSLEGMLGHEIAHLVHRRRRRAAGLANGSGPLWQLYEEGYAQRCEHLVLGREGWHMSCGINPPDWLDWCRRNVGSLAREFLRRIDSGQQVADFFGHWFDVQGRRQCGYFLGHEVIRKLEQRMPLEDIAALPDPTGTTRQVLHALSGG